MGAGIVIGLGLLGAGMLTQRWLFEPLLPLVLTALAGGRADYDPAFYDLWSWLAVGMAIFAGVFFLITWWRKPAEDRRIDAALRARLTETARGAPLERD